MLDVYEGPADLSTQAVMAKTLCWKGVVIKAF